VQPYRFYIAYGDMPLQIRAKTRRMSSAGTVEHCEAILRFRARVGHAYGVELSPTCEPTLLAASDPQTRWKVREVETLICPAAAPQPGG
jgi:hypothetical protein